MCTCIIHVNYYTCIWSYRAFWHSHGSRLQTCLHPDSSFHGYSARPHRYNDSHYFLTPPTTLIFHSHLTGITHSQISDTRFYRWLSVIARSDAITGLLIKHWLKPSEPPLWCIKSCLEVEKKIILDFVAWSNSEKKPAFHFHFRPFSFSLFFSCERLYQHVLDISLKGLCHLNLLNPVI